VPQQQAAVVPPQAPAAPAEPTPSAADVKAAPALAVPTFDIVRVEPSGDAVVAGQGMPGATVELLRNGVPYARTVADVGGQWAIVPTPLPKGAGELSLRITTPDGRTSLSEQVVAVRVPENPEEGVVVVLNAPNMPAKVLSETTMVASAQPGAVASDAAGQPKASDQAAPGEPQGNASAEPAPKPPGAPRANAQIQAVEADEAGQFFVTGHAEPGAEIRIYLNEAPIASVRAAKDGAFGMKVEKGMKPGSYAVRADDIDVKTGKVLTRAEVPFIMEAKQQTSAPAAVVTSDAGDSDAAAAAQGKAVASDNAAGAEIAGVATGAKPVASAATADSPTPSVAVVPELRTVTIARGDSLWRISRKTYGEGNRYTVIYDANAKQIRNPDLIYPGQIFVMPDMKAN
jgi:nucleoid-associated protein YgaU